MIWILVVLLAGVAAFMAYLLFRQRGSTVVRADDHDSAITVATPIQAKPAPNKRQHWGKQFIVIDPDEACPQAREMHGHCFAYGKVPSVPLQGCAHTNCTCHFRDIDERRSGLERRSGKERRDDVRFEDKADRRSGKDRRNSDDRYDWRYNP